MECALDADRRETGMVEAYTHKSIYREGGRWVNRATGGTVRYFYHVTSVCDDLDEVGQGFATVEDAKVQAFDHREQVRARWQLERVIGIGHR
jgi:hypothetical protein